MLTCVGFECDVSGKKVADGATEGCSTDNANRQGAEEQRQRSNTSTTDVCMALASVLYAEVCHPGVPRVVHEQTLLKVC